jgi:hypothetical protein
MDEVRAKDGLPLSVYRKVRIDEPWSAYQIDSNGIVYGQEGYPLVSDYSVTLRGMKDDQKIKKTTTIDNLMGEVFLVNDKGYTHVINSCSDIHGNHCLTNLRWATKGECLRRRRYLRSRFNGVAPDDLDTFVKVDGIEDLLVARDGRVYSISQGLLLKPHRSGKYLRVCVNGQKYGVHILVAKAYLPNPLDLECHNQIVVSPVKFHDYFLVGFCVEVKFQKEDNRNVVSLIIFGLVIVTLYIRSSNG